MLVLEHCSGLAWSARRGSWVRTPIKLGSTYRTHVGRTVVGKQKSSSQSFSFPFGQHMIMFLKREKVQRSLGIKGRVFLFVSRPC